MIADFKPYPKYKDSGVSWLGNVPEHWELLPNRAVFSEVIERGFIDEQMLSVTITRGVIRQSDLLKNSSKKDSSNEDKSHYKLLQPGDLAYNKMRAWQGAIGLSEYRGIISPAYIVVRPRGLQNPRYFHYLLRTPSFATEAERWSYGITSDMWSLRYEDFKQIYCVVPPLEEQNGIVRYLDHADRLIRRYIRAKQKLIKLLNEQKQAIIHQAVTRGLDLNARLKPSGVEWLGDVPEHWDISRLKYLFKEIDDRTDTGEETLFSLRMYLGLVEHKSVSEKIITSQNLVGFKRVQPNQLVMNRMQASNGLFGIMPAFGLVSPDYAIFSSIKPICLDYFVYLFKLPLMRTVFRAESKGLGTGTSGFLRLYTDRFGRIKVPFPPYEEQNSIVNFIKKETQNTDKVIEQLRMEVQLVQQYQSRLISDIVTGKVDIHHTANTLPEEVFEQMALGLANEPNDEEPIIEVEGEVTGDEN